MTNICKKVNFEELYGCCDTTKRTIAYLIFGDLWGKNDMLFSFETRLYEGYCSLFVFQ